MIKPLLLRVPGPLIAAMALLLVPLSGCQCVDNPYANVQGPTIIIIDHASRKEGEEYWKIIGRLKPTLVVDLFRSGGGTKPWQVEVKDKDYQGKPSTRIPTVLIHVWPDDASDKPKPKDFSPTQSLDIVEVNHTGPRPYTVSVFHTGPSGDALQSAQMRKSAAGSGTRKITVTLPEKYPSDDRFPVFQDHSETP